MEIYTTLRQIEKGRPCTSGFRELLKIIGDDYPPDQPIYALDMIESHLSISNIFWGFNTAPDEQEDDINWLLIPLACDCLERDLPIFDSVFPGDPHPREIIALTRELFSQKQHRCTEETYKRVGKLLSASEIPTAKLETQSKNVSDNMTMSGALPVLLRMALRVARHSQKVLAVGTGFSNWRMPRKNYVTPIIQNLAQPVVGSGNTDMVAVGLGGEIRWIKNSDVLNNTSEFIKENDVWIRGKLKEHLIKYEDEGAESA